MGRFSRVKQASDDLQERKANLEATSALEDMPAEKVPEPMEFLWGQSGTIAQLVAIMAHHEADHAAKIEQQRSIPPEAH